jgi:hypothetical protein
MVRRVSVRRPLRHALWWAGLLLGFAATWIGRPELIVLDTFTGFALVMLGLGVVFAATQRGRTADGSCELRLVPRLARADWKMWV